MPFLCEKTEARTPETAVGLRQFVTWYSRSLWPEETPINLK